jgi:V8-like Glu-specific endopeptidase
MIRRATKAPAAAVLLGVSVSLYLVNPADAASPVLPEIRSREVPVGVDSGHVRTKATEPATSVLFETPVSVPGAKWLRLTFGDVHLAGDPGADGATIRITSGEDGAVQYLNAETLRQWGWTSAYFNGDTLKVEVIGFPGQGESRVVIQSVTAGEPVGGSYATRSLCGGDDRTPSAEPGSARLMPMGCTGFMIDDANKMFLTAGHCSVNSQTVVQFNVPMSRADGTLMMPSPQDQYAVDPASIQSRDQGIGNDWSYFGVFPNSNTSLTPVQVQGQNYTLVNAVRNAGGTVRITGFGLVSAPVSLTLNQVQKSATGGYVSRTGTVLGYSVDTTGGNSGSPIIDTGDGRVLGIHTNGGCDGAGSNEGTSLDNPDLRYALANPRGVCRSGTVPPGGGPGNNAVFAAGDLVSNFGAFASGGSFAALAQTLPSMQGMAYDPATGRFLAIDTARTLYAITPEGSISVIGSLAGTTQVINGLGYDPGAQKLYAFGQATGQLYQVYMGPRLLSPIGIARGGLVGGIDYDTSRRVLFGIDDAGGSRLVRINIADGSRTVVGVLGSGATDCNGLAFNPNDEKLYTVDAPTGRLLAVDPDTGVATVVGTTNGTFGAAFGMAAREVTASNCSADFNRDGDWGTDQDVEAFFAALAGHPCPTCGSVDINGDGDIGTDQDIEAFFRALAGHPC